MSDPVIFREIDLSAALTAQASANEIRTESASSPVETIDGKPAIQLPGRGVLLSEFAAELGTHLRGEGIFSRKGCAFTLNPAEQQLELATPGWLRTWIEKNIVPYVAEVRDGNRITIKKSISEDMARAVCLAPQFLEKLRAVEHVNPCQMPVMRGDGQIELLCNGIDEDSETLTIDAGFAPELLPLNEAAEILRGLLAEFAWAEDQGRSLAVHVGAMLTVFAKGVLPRGTTCPVFLYLANAEGAGKTLLAQLAGIPYAELPAAEAGPRDDAEWAKKLLAITVSGRRLVLLDNMKGFLNAPALEAYTTSPSFRGRILGMTREFCAAAGATVLITGNGMRATPDMRRRSLIVELFLTELKAEDRVFRRTLDAETIRRERPKIIAALWSIVRAWDEAGRPPCSSTNASFPRWSETIAGMVEFAGFGSPLAPADLENMGDTDSSDIVGLVKEMESCTEYTFEGIVELATECGFFERILSDRDHDGSLSRAGKRRFSALLGRYDRRRILANASFLIQGKGHARRYFVR